MRRDLFFLVINTILLAIIALNTVLTLRTVKSEIDHHRRRNEAENLCQLSIVFTNGTPTNDIETVLRQYQDCVLDYSGGIQSPLRPIPPHR